MALDRFRFDPNGPRAGLRTVAAIVIGNLIPILGVLFLGWSAGQILILYWIENAIVGFYALLRILSAQAEDTNLSGNVSGRLGVAAFFTVHYGIFWAVHGVFANLLAYSFHDTPEATVWTVVSFGLAVLAMIVAHGLIFARWLRGGSARTATPGGEMFRPYGRLVVLHVTVLLGAFGLSQLGAPAWTVTLLCVGKMVLELGVEAGRRLFGRPTTA